MSKDATRQNEKSVTSFQRPIPEAIDCVALGWFMPTHMWPREATGQTKTVWVVRLEKLDLSERSWWSNAAHASLSSYPGAEEHDWQCEWRLAGSGESARQAHQEFGSKLWCAPKTQPWRKTSTANQAPLQSDTPLIPPRSPVIDKIRMVHKAPTHPWLLTTKKSSTSHHAASSIRSQ